MAGQKRVKLLVLQDKKDGMDRTDTTGKTEMGITAGEIHRGFPYQNNSLKVTLLYRVDP